MRTDIPKISERLKAIAGMTDKGLNICDIGCDHALLPIYLIKTGQIESAIAMDIGESSLAGAKSNIREFGLEDKIELRLSDGFCALRQGETDCAVIAGIGGMLMLDILKRGRDKWKDMESIILSPQRDERLIREYMSGLCYYETDKIVSERNKFYTIMKFLPRIKPGEICPEKILYGINPSKEFLLYKRALTSSILDAVSDALGACDEKKEALQKEMEILDNILVGLEQ